MDANECQQNKKRFLELCHEYIKREGLENLLKYLEKSDFYEAPSSVSYHLNEPGGLCRHSINVFETALKLHEAIAVPAILEGNSTFVEAVKTESIAIAALFHDLCKVKLYHSKKRWKKDETDHWISYQGYEAKDDFPLGHGEKSCLIISWFMRLSGEELLAIRWHMGMFDMAENGTAQRYAFREAMEKSPLVSLIQAADMLSSNLLEKTTQY